VKNPGHVKTQTNGQEKKGKVEREKKLFPSECGKKSSEGRARKTGRKPEEGKPVVGIKLPGEGQVGALSHSLGKGEPKDWVASPNRRGLNKGRRVVPFVQFLKKMSCFWSNA